MTAGVYLHIPFCKSRCSYCDFATDVWRDSGSVERYVNALCREILSEPTAIAGASDTIYFGGGTPSLLKPEQVERILNAVHEKFDVTPDAEITMEMNPATVTPESLAAYKKLGVNRASFGVQTFNERDLKLLARGHDAEDARTTFKMLRDAGFENVSFDLIAGLPGQDLDGWRGNLDGAFAMSPEHISLYLLEIHQGTPLAEQIRSGRQPEVDDDLAAEMYDITGEYIARSGYQQYEISNYSKPGFESRHNSKYWTLDPVFGFGVSAHSFDGRQRYANQRDTAAYVAKIESGESPEVSREEIDQASEFIFLGLRLNAGIDLAYYQHRFGVDIRTTYADALATLTDAGLVEIVDEHLSLTDRGRRLSNEVFQFFV